MTVSGALTVFADVSPACSPAERGVVKDARFRRQADRTNVWSDAHRLAQFHQGDVIIEQCVVVLWMDGDGLNTNSYFIGVGRKRDLGLSSQVQRPAVGVSTVANRNRINICLEKLFS